MKLPFALITLSLVSAPAFGCSNFSGDWVGTCTDAAGNQKPFQRNFYQKGCEEFGYDGYGIAVGKESTRRVEQSGRSLETTQLYYWDEGRTKLHSRFIARTDTSVARKYCVYWLEGDTLKEEWVNTVTRNEPGRPGVVQGHETTFVTCSLKRK